MLLLLHSCDHFVMSCCIDVILQWHFSHVCLYNSPPPHPRVCINCLMIPPDAVPTANRSRSHLRGCVSQAICEPSRAMGAPRPGLLTSVSCYSLQQFFWLVLVLFYCLSLHHFTFYPFCPPQQPILLSFSSSTVIVMVVTSNCLVIYFILNIFEPLCDAGLEGSGM